MAEITQQIQIQRPGWLDGHIWQRRHQLRQHEQGCGHRYQLGRYRPYFQCPVHRSFADLCTSTPQRTVPDIVEMQTTAAATLKFERTELPPLQRVKSKPKSKRANAG